ncbi:Nse4 C-terminal-domain-containing protein [Mycena olivaceomarginata]|nr:Nse4 C-terminal-domain-containing protein [Mycena olivaceomarginata]
MNCRSETFSRHPLADAVSPMSSQQSPRKDLVYDPDQDANEKREIRGGYRSLHRLIDNPHGDLSPTKLTSNVKRADELFSKVKAPQEATLDSAFLLKTSNTSARYARALKLGSGGFDRDDFVTRLILFMGGYKAPEDASSDFEDDSNEYLDWAKIGRRALAKSRRVPAMGFMLGPLSIEQKARAAHKPRAKLEKNKNDERKPQEIREEDIARSENETTKNVATVATLLEQVERVNLFKVVINPDSFAQSAENIFYLSFLIRDAKVAFEIDDESGEPFVFACQEPTDEERAEAGGLLKRQLIFEFDMATWERAIDVFNITESFIPTRPRAGTRLGDKWYG